MEQAAKKVYRVALCLEIRGALGMEVHLVEEQSRPQVEPNDHQQKQNEPPHLQSDIPRTSVDYEVRDNARQWLTYSKPNNDAIDPEGVLVKILEGQVLSVMTANAEAKWQQQ